MVPTTMLQNHLTHFEVIACGNHYGRSTITQEVAQLTKKLAPGL